MKAYCCFSIEVRSVCNLLSSLSSLPQVISVISIAFVVVSTVGMTLNTLPSVQHRGPPTHAHPKGEPIDNPKLALIEAICISWFTIEYLLRHDDKTLH